MNKKAGKLHIGMSLAPTWFNGDGWRRSDSRVEDILSGDYYLDLARRSEAAHLDFVFRPDALALPVEMLENGPGFTSLDPTVLLASLARETSHIGLLTTVSTTFLPPYVVARQIQSLNWLSRGRVGWNIVTALLGNENFGLDEMPSAEARYERADEFVTIVRQLWESYPSEAVELNRMTGRYANPQDIRTIDHSGKHFRVKGPLTLPACDVAPIPLIQAGASPTGKNFAASIADAVFASTPDMQVALDLRADLRLRAKRQGRLADDVLLLPGLSLYLGDTRKAAEELFAETHARTGRERALANIRSMLGIDLSEWPSDRRIVASDLPFAASEGGSQTHKDLLRRMIAREEPAIDELLRRPEVIGSGHWQIVGTVEDAVAEIRQWSNAGAIDGFIAVPGGSPSSVHLTLSELVPRLAECGLFRDAYSSDTFWGHLKET